ncbi:amidohydrolase [Streptomyces xanthii]|uniref:Amidohydrolase family protein n=1 Tax=Streptomyces xanthii TaxID=2768069 RepID=A0A7H1BGY5_9ACTN|nr:amidohydrolase [Streptomyces xanthii]QNS07990.1 amidohydrolase family protein [Streptomyces xanthii]
MERYHHLRIEGVRPLGETARDLVIHNGRFVRDTTADVIEEVLDGGGMLALPAPVDAHIHPDKTTWGGPWLSREPTESLAGLIAYDASVRADMAPVAERAGALLDHAIAHGTRAMRAHADVAPQYGLDNVRGLRAAADARAHLLDVQIVAFPQLGVLTAPGTDVLLEKALDEGADLVGGLDPVGVDGDRDGQLDLLFGLAERRGVELDIHLHDGGASGLDQITEIARRTTALGLAGRVTVSHAFALAELEGPELTAMADLLAGAGVAVTTCALGADPVVPHAALTRAGARVAVGSDGVCDPWSPFGNAEMLDRAHLLAYRTDARTDDELAACYRLVADQGADLLGLDRVGFRPGEPADLVLVDAPSVAEAIVRRTAPSVVVRAGRVIARNGTLLPGGPA